MCAPLEKLRTDLRCVYTPLVSESLAPRRPLSIYERARGARGARVEERDIVRKTTLITKRTGSMSFVYKVVCRPSTGAPFSLFAKVQNTPGAEFRGLEHEKVVYGLMTKVVDYGICPFRLRSYEMLEAPNVLLTETFDDMVELREYVRHHLHPKDRKHHARDCRNLLIQILYAIEVNFRLGVRHNDMHLSNMMVQFCPARRTSGLYYVSRKKDWGQTILMRDCNVRLKIFDWDRGTKQVPKNAAVKGEFGRKLDPKPVSDLWPWYEPSVYTEKFDLFKTMQEISHHTPSDHMIHLLASLRVALSEAEMMRVLPMHGRRDFIEYYMITNDSHRRREPLAPQCRKGPGGNDRACTVGRPTRRATFPDWLQNLRSSDQALEELVADQRARPAARPGELIGDMRKLYKKIVPI